MIADHASHSGSRSNSAGPLPRTHRVLTALALLAAVLLVLGGCASKLLIETRPSGAGVVVIDARGKTVKAGMSPLRADLKFPKEGTTRYRIVVTPTPEQAEVYESQRAELTEGRYGQLPVANKSTRTLALTLHERPYQSIPAFEVTLDPQGQWVGVATKVRAYEDIAESGGTVPSLVVDFGENRGIQGLTLSPDGDRLVYAEAVYEKPPADVNAAVNLPSIETLGQVKGDASPAVNPPSVYLLKGANLRGINIQGGGIQHITTEDFRDLYPSFTPDGKNLLFSSNRRRAGLLDILRIKAGGRSGISDIYVNHRDGMVLNPTQAADGTVAFTALNLAPGTGRVLSSNLWTVHGPNEFPTSITPGRSPAISPDGGHIAYIALDGNLWVIGTDGSTPTQLTHGAAQIRTQYRASLSEVERRLYDANLAAGVEQIIPFRDPSWTPDGENILFSSMNGVDATGRHNADLWVINVDGDLGRQLTSNGSADRYPMATPEADAIYFLSNRGKSWGIWKIPFAREVDE
ncbi:MAG: hypothetical protein V3V20_12840 [Algisphaera sp.]